MLTVFIWAVSILFIFTSSIVQSNADAGVIVSFVVDDPLREAVYHPSAFESNVTVLFHSVTLMFPAVRPVICKAHLNKSDVVYGVPDGVETSVPVFPVVCSAPSSPIVHPVPTVHPVDVLKVGLVNNSVLLNKLSYSIKST